MNPIALAPPMLAPAALTFLKQLGVSTDANRDDGTCTSVAHVAGALRRPVYIMLGRSPCWRWLADGDDTPWYESARLFRQNEHWNWRPVVDRVAACLQVI